MSGNNEITSSAFFEDASTATMVDSRGQFGPAPPRGSQKQPGDRLDFKLTRVKCASQIIGRDPQREIERCCSFIIIREMQTGKVKCVTMVNADVNRRTQAW